MNCCIVATLLSSLTRTGEVLRTAASIATVRAFGLGLDQPVILYGIVALAAFLSALLGFTLQRRSDQLGSFALELSSATVADGLGPLKGDSHEGSDDGQGDCGPPGASWRRRA
jgi:hypothetical protein